MTLEHVKFFVPPSTRPVRKPAPAIILFHEGSRQIIFNRTITRSFVAQGVVYVQVGYSEEDELLLVQPCNMIGRYCHTVHVPKTENRSYIGSSEVIPWAWSRGLAGHYFRGTWRDDLGAYAFAISLENAMYRTIV